MTLALDFNLLSGAVRDFLVVSSYAMKEFGMLLQGLSIPALGRRAAPQDETTG